MQDRVVDVRSGPAADLIARHLPLVRSLARRYSGRGEGFEDLVQVGAVGLVAAVGRFDPGRGVPFAAYAAPVVEGELRRHLRDRAATIRLPRRQQEHVAAVRRAERLLSQRLGHEASAAEAGAAVGLSAEEARLALDGPVAIVPLSEVEGRESDVAGDEFAACEERELVRELLGSLPERERALVQLRFGGDLSQAEIARRLHISQSQASRLLAAALAKLRTALESVEHQAA